MDKIGRLDYIDAMRALALFGILFVHSHDHFNFYVTGLPYGSFDWLSDWCYEHLFLGKAFMLFSLLFGVSFSLQLMRSEQRGVDFRGRYLWRLCLLFAFGIIHSFFYCGDILIIFAALGIFPLMLWRLPSKWLFLIASLLLLSPLCLYNDLMGQAMALFEWYKNYVATHQLPSAPSPLSASWAQIATWNIETGTQYAWLYMIWSNRLCLVLGMFLFGAALGKSRFIDSKLDLHARCAWGFFLAYAFLQSLIVAGVLPLLAKTMGIWANVLFVLGFGSASSCLLRWSRVQAYLVPFIAMGRMSLTCYIGQSIIMTALLASWGCGLLMQLTRIELAAIALLLYLAQMFFCTIWLRHFKFGPLEYIWRLLTNIGR